MSYSGWPKLFAGGTRPEPRGDRREQTHRRTGPGMRNDRSADPFCREGVSLLRRGGLCSERDAERRRGHALRSSTAVRLWPGLELQDVRVCHDGRLATGRTPGRSARCRAAVQRDKRFGAGSQRDPAVLRTDGQQQLAVGAPRRYTGAAAVLQRGTLMPFPGAVASKVELDQAQNLRGVSRTFLRMVRTFRTARTSKWQKRGAPSYGTWHRPHPRNRMRAAHEPRLSVADGLLDAACAIVRLLRCAACDFAAAASMGVSC